MSDSVSVNLCFRNSIVRDGLSRILAERGFQIVQSCTPGEDIEVVNQEYLWEPNIVLIEGGAEECDEATILALRNRFPNSNLVVLSDRFNFQFMLKAFRLGIRAYLLKEISCERLAGSLRLAAMGERVLPSRLADELQSRLAFQTVPERGPSVDAVCLSERERELLRWLIMGCPNKVISRHMQISEATVKVHVKAVFRKLEVKNRTQAAIWAANRGMRSPYHDVHTASVDNIRHSSPLPAVSSVAMRV